VLRNAAGEPISTGSGFVFHEDGWFITNNHVMENGYSATAYFDIPDRVQGTKHTMLAVLGGVYHDETKDVFIGKLENYEKIRSHYHPISFTEEYTQGETCYSIGNGLAYPPGNSFCVYNGYDFNPEDKRPYYAVRGHLQRLGAYDYELFYLLGQRDRAQACEIIRSVCTSFDDYDPTAEALDIARQRLLSLLG
jgi:hypothetical protein